MTITTYKTIPSHDQWKKHRDAAGGKSNLVGPVNMGKLLDDFANAGGNKVKRATAIEALRAGLIRYTADPKVKAIPDLLATCMNMQKVCDLEILANKKNKDMGLAVGLIVADGFKRIEKIKAEIKANDITQAQDTYEKFWDGIGRGLGKDLPQGALRDDWAHVHAAQPTATKFQPTVSQNDRKLLIEGGITNYATALHKLLEDAEKAGLVLKVG